MRHAFVVFALVLTGCTSFDSVSRGVCGNGLIEPGEDCDSSAASCVRCAVTCTKAADCPNDGYSCGTDGVCHAPGGTLAPPASAGPFQVNEFLITDVGHDGTGDVVGMSRTSIVVRNGQASGMLSTGTSLVTPFQTSRPAFGDLDGDGSVDITMTTVDGLVSYTSPLGQLTPLPVQSQLGAANSTLELIGLYRVSNNGLGAFLSSADDRVLVAVFDLTTDLNSAVILPCNLNFKASAFGETSYDVNRLSADSDNATELLLSITGPTIGGGVRTCVMTITKTPATMAVITDITPVSAIGLTGRPVLADLDFNADRCPGLLSAGAGGMLRYWAGSRSGLNCTISNVPSAYVPNATPGATLVARFPLIPNIALVAADVVVMSDGVYASTVVGISKVYSSTRTIARVDFGDLNGDGRVDGVVASEGEDDIDILYRTVNPGYQLVRLDTASRVSSLTVGDFDGNGIDDIAYTELLDQFQRLEVAFCTTDRPLDPVTVGAFPNNISVIRMQIPDSLDQQGLAADLAVLTLKTGTRPTTVTLLHGSPQRTMLPYYDPTPNPISMLDKRKPYQLRGVVFGRFAGDALPDIAALGIPLAGHLDNTTGTPLKGWVLKGTVVGPDGTMTPGKPLSGIVDCARTDPGTSNLCLDDAQYLPLSVGDHDQVMMFDRNGRVGVIDPTSPGATLAVTPPGTPLGSTPLHSGFTADLEGDGSPELVLAYPPAAGFAGMILACKLSNAAPSGCTDLLPTLLGIEGVTECVDAAPGRVHYRDPFTTDDNKAVELVVLCHGGGSSMLERVRSTEHGYQVDELSRVPEQLDSLRVGDVTGDGLDDIAALANDHGAETLEVFRQCSSRDVNACRGGGP